MNDISIKRLKKSYGIHEVLSDVSFDINSGDKIALIGANGSGKTTLFKIISKRTPYDDGDLIIRKNIRVSCLDQIADYPSHYCGEDVINEAFSHLFEMKSELDRYDNLFSSLEGDELDRVLKLYGELQSKFEGMGGYEIETLKNRMCQGLKIDSQFLEKDYRVLSGGEQTTLNLAKILLEAPEVLLLDEPSNHLDIDALEWLEEYLKNYKGSVVIISHDRYFINRTVNKIVELESGESSIFHGNYDYYKGEKERRLLQEFEEYKDQQRKVKAMKEAAKRFRIWARGDHDKFFRKAKEMERRIEKIEMLDRPKMERDKVSIDFQTAQRSGNNVIICKGLEKSFGDKRLFKNLDFKIYFKEKVALLGGNGSGKSTIVKMILNKHSADSGEIELGASVKVAYLDQHIEFENHNQTVLECYKSHYSLYEDVARNELANFLFYRDGVFKLIKDLSGGERTRLKLALLMRSDTNLLLLDEPTNHLDIDSKEMLEDALEKFKGTIFFISHDRYFINKIANRVMELKGGGVENYEGNYEFYKEINLKRRRLAEEAKVLKMEEESRSKRVKEKPAKISKTKRVDIDKLEAEIMEIEEEIENLNSEISSNGSDFELVSDNFRKIKLLEDRLEDLYEMIP